MTPEVGQQLSRAALAGATGFALSWMLTPLVRRLAVSMGLSTKPAEDRWGKRVIARLGGVAMFLSFAGAAVLWVPMGPQLAVLLIAVAVVFGLGLLDDVRRMPPYTKLIAQLLIGCSVVLAGVRIELLQWPWLAVPLSVLWFVLIMNAFNLLDNMDGLAAGIGAIAGAFSAGHAVLAAQWQAATLNLILCGTCVGFLRYNFPPAKIYMGDAGSHFLGLSLAALSLMGTWRHSTQLLSVLAVPALVLAVPIFDTCFVAIQRLTNRQHPFVGGTDHVSHRLAVLGLSTRQTALALYTVSACFGFLSFFTANLKLLPTVVVWMLTVTVLAVFGLYLAKVQVYRLGNASEAPLAAARAERVTLIDTMLLHKRRLVEILLDFCLISSAYVVAYVLRFEGTLTGDLQQLVIQSLPVILVIKLVCFAGFGLYRGVWRYLGLSDLMTLLKAVVLSSVLSACGLLYLWRFEGYSRAVFVIDGMLTFFAIGGARVAERIFDDWIHRLTSQGVPVVIIGAGDTGARVLRSLRYDGAASRQAVGFLDDDPRKLGSRIHGCSVLGTREALARVLEAHHVQEALIAINDPPGELLQHVQRCCEPRGVTWKVVTAGVTEAA